MKGIKCYKHYIYSFGNNQYTQVAYMHSLYVSPCTNEKLQSLQGLLFSLASVGGMKISHGVSPPHSNITPDLWTWSLTTSFKTMHKNNGWTCSDNFYLFLKLGVNLWRCLLYILKHRQRFLLTVPAYINVSPRHIHHINSRTASVINNYTYIYVSLIINSLIFNWVISWYSYCLGDIVT